MRLPVAQLTPGLAEVCSLLRLRPSRVWRSARPDPSERNARIVELRRGGQTLDQIAVQFGITRERVRQVVARDAPELPSAIREERNGKALAAVTCPDCGGPKAVRSPACQECGRAARLARRKTRLIAAIKKWDAQYGEPPKATDWNPAALRAAGREDLVERFSAGGWPGAGTVQAAFGSWSAGIEAAGFPRRQLGQYDRSRARKRAAEVRTTPEAVIERIMRWAELHGGTPPRLSDWLLAPTIDGERFPSWSTVRARFGSWDAAIEAAGFTPQRYRRKSAAA